MPDTTSESRIRRFRERVPGLVHGADYNPEQWPREVWAEDVRLMKQANLRLVSLGVFSWSALEPKDGSFTFDWLDEIVDLLWADGIAVNLATPNAAPPPWLAEDFPETLMVERNGTRVAIGSRGHFCPSSPVYRDRSRRMARELGERYGSHPAVVMWHIGNEYHSYCYCDLCDEEFRGWLQRRYATLDELNERWGTLFWSQYYSDWSQVHVPKPVRGWVNPARDLDYKRFNSDLQLALYTAERDLLRSITPDIPTTTNFVQFFPVNDYRRWVPELDVVAFDIYPDPGSPTSLVVAAMQYDLMRSMGGGRSWMVMEQAAAAVSQWKRNLAKQPGWLRLSSYQAVSRGADSIMYFQWRASRYGQEKFHSAMLPHGGEDARSWQEARDLGNELALLDPVVGATSEASVAIVWDWDNWWAVEGCAHPSNEYSYKKAVTSHYRALWEANVATDVVSLSEDLSRYRVLVVPNQYLMDEAQRAAVRRFVDGGGHLLVSFFSGIVDENDRVLPDGYPGGLRVVIGGHVRDFSPLAVGAEVPVALAEGQDLLPAGFAAVADYWQDDLVAEAGTPVAVYTEGYLAGQPAVLDNRLGEGSAVYVGAQLDREALGAVTRAVLARAGIGPVHEVPAGVEATERRTAVQRFLFLLNHGAEQASVRLDRAGTDLLTGTAHEAGALLDLGPSGVAVVASPSVHPEPTCRH